MPHEVNCEINETEGYESNWCDLTRDELKHSGLIYALFSRIT